jgi:hypothetical protein
MAKLSFCILFFLAGPVLAETVDGRWHPGIGDPTFFGWLTVLVYAVAIWVCFKKYQSLSQRHTLEKPMFWLLLTLGLLLLGINKQLDLQTWFTQTFRDMSKAHGWYGQRRVIQVIFIVCVGLGFLIAMTVLRTYLARSFKQYKRTWMGISLLCLFILIRAASFHHMDLLISSSWFGLSLNVILENGALLLIIAGAYKNNNAFVDVTLNHDAQDSVTIETAKDDVLCPRCGYPALSAVSDGRLFKCKRCEFKYKVFIND